MNKSYLLKIYLSIISLCLWSSSSIAQNYNVTTTPQCNNVAGGNEIVNFTSATPTAVGNGTVTMYFRGDFDGKTSGGEYMELLGETGPVIGNTVNSTTGISNTQCNVNYDSIVVPVAMADINNWAADGTISFTADAAANVSASLCYSPAVAYCVYMRLEYPRASGLNDIGIASIDTPTVFCAGTQNIWVTVQNYGLNQINNCTINWTWNGITQTPLNVNQLIDTAQGLNPNFLKLMLGTKTITDADTLKVWTSNPNNGVDTTNINDTLSRIIAPALVGTYTINSAVPTGGTNYQSFTAFANDLKTYRVCGPVVANVVSGSGPYNEQVDIPASVGFNATNTLTINGNGATLTQTLTGTPASYATFNLDGADYVTVRNLKIEALGTNGFGIHLMNGADNNTFKNCTITASPTATGTTSACVSMSGSAASYSATGVNGSNNSFDSCTLAGGYFGFVFYGSGTTSPIDSNNNITNCTISEYYVYGIYDYYQRSANRENNLMERPTRSSISTGYGIYNSTCVNMMIQKNTIRDLFGGLPTSTSTAYPIYVTGDGTAGNENKIINNEIYNIQGNGTIGGMYLTGADYIQVYNNTIRLDYTAATAGTTYGIYNTGTVGGIDIKNNNIYITRGGTGVKQCLYYTGAGAKSSNYNNLYIAPVSTNFIGATGTTAATQFATLSAWQSATGTGSPWDVNSVSIDPVFTSTTNLEPTNFNLDDLGTPIAIVTDDINGVLRNGSSPDIGAYEYTVPVCTSPPTAGDAVITPTNLCSGGTVQFNLAGNSIGIGQTYEWQSAPTATGPFSAVSSAQSNPVFSTTVSATAYYRAAVTCGSTTSYSDTVLVTVPGIFPGGTYTINSALPTGSGNFQSFSDAVLAIRCGISGPVTFNVAPASGPYVEQIDLPATIGSDVTNTVTFNGNGRTISLPTGSTLSNLATINISGADYVTFKNLNIEALTDGFGVHLMNGSDNNTFKNCTIAASPTATTTTSACISMSGSANSYSTAGVNGSGNSFDSCTLSGGYFGVALYGSGVVATSDSNNNITNCTIRDFYVYGIYNYYNRSYNIANNLMERPTRAVVSTGYGVMLTTGSVNVTVQKNTIRGLFAADPGNANTAYPIYVSVDGTVGNENKIINNEIYNIQGNGTIGGLYLTGADYIQVYNNTINLDYTAATAGTTYGIYSTGTVGGIDIKNNNISITRGGTGVKQCLYYTGAGAKSSNYNNLYIAPASTNFVGATGTTAATQFATLSAWQSATGTGSPFDANSASVDPVFVSASNLKPTSAALDNLGTPIASVVDDIDGVVRNASTPDIGAYEFVPPTCQAPTSIIVSNPTNTTLDISWTSNSTATLRQIEYKQGTSAFTLGTGTRVGPTGVTNPYTVTGLTAGTPYTFYVREICAIGDTSFWSAPQTGFTAFPAIPANDDCFTPVDISNGALYYGTTVGATQTLAPCDATTVTATDVWYTFTTGGTAGIVSDSVNTSFSGGDVVVQMYSGACGSLTPLVPTGGTTFNATTGCVDGPAAGMEWSTYSLAANTTYFIRVYAFVAASNPAPSGPFSIQITGSPLAVKLDKISATNAGTANRVDWNTLSEESSDKFELERSIDGKNFATIYEKRANGEASRYTYMDNNAVKGTNYYRLRMTAANGSVNYSEVVTAFVKSNGFEVDAYPNPVSHDLTVKVSGVQGADASVQVTDVTGKLIRTVKMNSSVETIDMSGLANGIYLIKYSDATHAQTIKVNKQ